MLDYSLSGSFHTLLDRDRDRDGARPLLELEDLHGQSGFKHSPKLRQVYLSAQVRAATVSQHCVSARWKVEESLPASNMLHGTSHILCYFFFLSWYLFWFVGCNLAHVGLKA